MIPFSADLANLNADPVMQHHRVPTDAGLSLHGFRAYADSGMVDRASIQGVLRRGIFRWSLFIGCLLSLSGIGCRDQSMVDPRLRSGKRGGYVAVVAAGPHDPLSPMIQAAVKRSQTINPWVEVRFFNPESQRVQAQIDLLRGQIENPEFRGLCIHPMDASALAPTLEELRTRGITIVTMVEPVSTDHVGTGRFMYVGFDDAEIGNQLAQATIDYLGEKGGSIMVLHAGELNPRYEQRYRAFNKALQHHRTVEIFAELDCKADAAEARRLIRDRNQRYPRLSAWVSMDDWALKDLEKDAGEAAHADAVAAVAKELFGQEWERGQGQEHGQGPRYITFGGLPRQWELVRQGFLQRLVAADYGSITERAITACIDCLRDPTQQQQDFYVPLRIISPKNLDAYIHDWSTWSELPTTSKP